MTKLKLEEQYIIGENPDTGFGDRFFFGKKFIKIFPAFESRNYRLYFSGQLISLIGTWLQYIALGWLVLQLTNSAFMLGFIGAMSTLPTMLFSLFAGVIIDRFPKRKVLIFTQAFSMIQAIILGILTIAKIITVWQIAVLAFLLGTINAIDAPARQTFAVDLVKKRSLASAIALNAGVFNAARVVGPGIAGLLIGFVGIGGTFIFNGISYIAVIVALLYMSIKENVVKHDLHPIKAIEEGLRYVFSNDTLRVLFFMVASSSVFGWSHTTILPVVAKRIFHLDATGLGFLFSSSGLGAVTAMIVISALSNKKSPIFFILIGNIIFTVSLMLFTFTTSFSLGLVLLFFSGFGILAQLSQLNTTVQYLVEDRIRGRVMSIYVLFLIGFFPIGNLQIGWLAEHYGSLFAIRANVLVVFLSGIIFFFFKNKIKKNLRDYSAKGRSRTDI